MDGHGQGILNRGYTVTVMQYLSTNYYRNDNKYNLLYIYLERNEMEN